MRRSHLLTVLAATLLFPASTLAETSVSAPDEEQTEAVVVAESAEDLSWEQFDDPDFDPTAVGADSSPTEAKSADAGVPAEAAAPETADSAGAKRDDIELSVETTDEVPRGGVLGPRGVDDQGRAGRLHTVASGDTLWDLSATYLGTPWVWPSVWIDNDDIDNPHLITPGQRIWITANEMRVVTDAEAEAFLEPRVVESASVAQEMPPAAAVDVGEDVAVLDDRVPPLAALESADDPSALDAFPVAVVEEPETMEMGRQVTISRREAIGFVSAEELAGASSIVESPSERTFLAAGDDAYLGMGEGDVEIGDHFTIFRVVEEVRDIETNRLLGHHVENLGWLEVKKLTGDTSIGEIRQSYSPIRRGARVMVRRDSPRRVTVRNTPDAIAGKIVFLPSERTVMSDGGFVYLNRGEFHGIEVGSELDVYEAGSIENDRIRRVDVQTPDHSVAKLIVVSVQPESCVAFVLSADRELEVGDTVRPAFSRLAQR